MKKKLKLPKFKNEDEEREFWAKIDLSAYIRQGSLKRVSFPNLKLTSQSISLRVPKYLLIRMKEKANALGMPYQSLIKKYLADAVLKEK